MDAFFATWHLQLTSTPLKGRALSFADSSLSKGAVVAVDQPISAVLNDREIPLRCDSCFLSFDKLLRCSKCHVMKYCSRLCQKEAWKEHRLECLCFVANKPHVPSRSIRLMLRLIGSGNWKDTSHLIDHLDKINQETLSSIVNLSITTAKILEISCQSCPLSIDQLTRIFAAFLSNCLVISDDEIKEVGLGLYPHISLLNHSCIPNAVVHFQGKRASLRSLTELRRGDEIEICYIDTAQTTRRRQNSLKQSFFFICDCSLCLLQERDRSLLSFCCDECSNVLMLKSWEPMEFECKYGHTQSNITLSQAISKRLGINIQIDENYPSSELISHLESLSSIQLIAKLSRIQQIMPKRNILYYEIQRILLDLLIIEEKWDHALEIALEHTNTMKELFGMTSPVLGIQYYRLGKLQMLPLDIGARESFYKAREILQLTHGPCQILEKLEQSIHEVEIIFA